MATKKVNTGRRFGEEKPVQRNKDEAPEGKQNRSPGESNANRRMPSVNEDVGKSTQKDIERVKKGIKPTGKSELTRATQKQAAGKAASRLAGRAGYMGYALTLGKELGDKVIAPRMLKNYEKDLEKTGVKLSKDAQRRVNEMKAKEKEDKDFEEMSAALRKVDREDADAKFFKEERMNRERKAKGLRYDAEFLGENPKKQYAKGGMAKKGKK